jgi:hypothetical protein
VMQGSKADSNEAIRGIVLGIKKGDVISMKKRIMSLLLVLVMFFSVLPIMPARRSAAKETETLFDRYIPVNQAYSAKVSPFSVTEGVSYSFSIGTRFKDETAETIIFADELKRSEMQGQFFKINYLGTVGTLKKADIMKYFLRKIVSVSLASLIVIGSACAFLPSYAHAATSSDTITLRVCNWEEYIDEGDWDETIDLESGDIKGENSMIADFEDWYYKTYGKKD